MLHLDISNISEYQMEQEDLILPCTSSLKHSFKLQFIEINNDLRVYILLWYNLICSIIKMQLIKYITKLLTKSLGYTDVNIKRTLKK